MFKKGTFLENVKNFHSEKNLFIFSLNLGPDPELDPDPHSSKRLDPDPNIMYADPKHWLKLLTLLFLRKHGTGFVVHCFEISPLSYCAKCHTSATA
jgi:hypothetical protein